jgi:ATP-dependent Lon protease
VVMRETAQAALSYARSRATRLGIEKNFYKEIDLHVHLPEGAIPKDGPSAGITIAVALISALTGVPTASDLAMTGEITLRGQVLPIGGLAEKIVAARRQGIERVLVPKGNQKDLVEVPKEAKRGLTILSVATMDEVLEHAMVGPVWKPAPEAVGEGTPPAVETPTPPPSPDLYAH